MLLEPEGRRQSAEDQLLLTYLEAKLPFAKLLFRHTHGKQISCGVGTRMKRIGTRVISLMVYGSRWLLVSRYPTWLQSSHIVAVAGICGEQGLRAHHLVREERPALPTRLHLYAHMYWRVAYIPLRNILCSRRTRREFGRRWEPVPM